MNKKKRAWKSNCSNCTYKKERSLISILVLLVNYGCSLRYRSVVVYVYAVKNDLTKWESNLNLDKPFMTNGEFLDALELNQNNIPTINGTGNYVVVVHAFDHTYGTST